MWAGWGGDEFAVFLYGSISLDLVRAKASQICGELQLVLGTEQTLTLTASVGVYRQSSLTHSPQWRLPERLAADLVCRLCANLDLDTIELLWEEGSDLSSQVQQLRCSQVLEAQWGNVFSKGEQRALEGYF